MDRTSGDGPFDVLEATIGDVRAAIEAGEETATSIVDRYRARIEAHDGELGSMLTVNPGADRRAAELDARYEADGFAGPLHGVPVVLKDNKDTHDMPTTAGSAALADSVPARDATVVERLREAGAVILAKANLQEFAYGVDTISSLGGETRNPYALDRRPSGSSGGTAAAIAANLGTVGTGTDTCSSVRSPPAFTNLVGLRPTQGLVSRSGIVPLSDTQDTAGPIARSVADAAKLLDVVAGYDPSDPVTAVGADRIPADGYASHLDEAGLDGARIGVVREFFETQDEETSRAASDRVLGVIEEALEELATAGATVVDPVSVVDADVLESARVVQYEFKRDLDRYLATLGDEVPYGSIDEIVDSGKVAPAIEERIRDEELLDVDVEGLEDDAEYLRRLDRRRRIEVDTVHQMVERDLDALAYPPSVLPPVRIPEHQPFAELRCELAAHTGLPAIVVPAGFTDDGLPVGIELLGRPFAEPRLVELAYGYERATRHRRPPDGFGPV